MISERIVLGSGKIYTSLFEGAIPDNEIIETDANMLGAIQGGATIEYKATSYKAIDDSGNYSRTVVTDEEAAIKCNIITFNAATLNKLISTGTLTETAEKRTLKIGGIQSQSHDKYVVRFLHEDSTDGDIRVTIVGNNQSGLSFAFAKNKESLIPVEFKALPSDTAGTLIVYEEEILTEIGGSGT